MRLTAKSEYGLLAVIDLAVRVSEGPVSAREISEKRAIPPRFLEQLFVSLRRAGIVAAVRGAKGGFVLDRDPSDITVLDIVEALEGPLNTSVCDTKRGVTCGQAGSCAAAPVWVGAAKTLRDLFASTNIADLAKNQKRMDERTPTTDEVTS